MIIGFGGMWVFRNSGVVNAQTLEDAINVSGVDQVHISTRNQHVNVIPISGNEAEIVASGLPNNATLNVSVEGTVLTVDVHVPRSIQIGVNIFGGIRQLADPPTLTVYLPEGLYEQITVYTTNGRIDISDFEIVDLQLDTSNGRIVASDITGVSARIRTNNGAVELSEVAMELDVQTSNGRITLDNETIAHDVELQSSNGAIEVNLAGEPENVAFSLSTTNGRTEIFGNQNTTQQFGDGRYEVTLRTTNGRIVVE